MFENPSLHGILFLGIFLAVVQTGAGSELDEHLESLRECYADGRSGSLGSDVFVVAGEGAARSLEVGAREAFRTFAGKLHEPKGDGIFAGWKKVLAGDGSGADFPGALKAHAEFSVQLQAEQLFEEEVGKNKQQAEQLHEVKVEEAKQQAGQPYTERVGEV